MAISNEEKKIFREYLIKNGLLTGKKIKMAKLGKQKESGYFVLSAPGFKTAYFKAKKNESDELTFVSVEKEEKMKQKQKHTAMLIENLKSAGYLEEFINNLRFDVKKKKTYAYYGETAVLCESASGEIQKKPMDFLLRVYKGLVPEDYLNSVFKKEMAQEQGRIFSYILGIRLEKGDKISDPSVYKAIPLLATDELCPVSVNVSTKEIAEGENGIFKDFLTKGFVKGLNSPLLEKVNAEVIKQAKALNQELRKKIILDEKFFAYVKKVKKHKRCLAKEYLFESSSVSHKREPNDNLCFLFRCNGYVFLYDYETKKLEFVSWDRSFEEYEALNREAKKYFEITEYMSKEFPSYTWTVNLEHDTFVVRLPEVLPGVKATVPSKGRGIPMVREMFTQRKVKNAQKVQKEKCMEDPLYGDLLASALLRLVLINNEKRHRIVSRSFCVKALRGLACPEYYLKTQDCGKFAIIPNDIIEQRIDDLINGGYVNERRVEGKYTEYYALSWHESSETRAILSPEPVTYPKQSKDAYEKYKDCDWGIMLKHKDPYTVKNWSFLLPIIEHPAVLSLYREEISLFFKDMENKKMYIKMLGYMKKTEMDKNKKKWIGAFMELLK